MTSQSSPDGVGVAGISLEAARDAIAQQQWVRARLIAEQILDADPGSAEGHYLLGVALWGSSEKDRAISELSAAVRLQPTTDRLNTLAAVLIATSRWALAVQTLAESLALDPENLTALAYDAHVACKQRRFQQALPKLRRVLEGSPDHALALTDLGAVQCELGEYDEAIETLSRVLRIRPETSTAHYVLSRVYLRKREYTKGIEHAQAIAELRGDAFSFAQLALACWEFGDLPNAFAATRRAYQAGVADPDVHSVLLSLALYNPELSAATLLEWHRQWEFHHSRKLPAHQPFENERNPERRLKLAMIGTALLTQPGRFFRVPLLRSLSKLECEVTVYTTAWNEAEELSQFLPGVVVRDVSIYDDDELHKLIREDRIDVLLDGIGQATFNRLPVFAMRSAPVQLNYASYPGTTGITECDGFLTDHVLSPPGTDAEYSEPLIRMDDGRFLYAPPPNAPDVAPAPHAETGYITFGIFQRTAKLSPKLMETTARVLLQLPESQLLIHHTDPEFDNEGSRVVQQLTTILAGYGVAPERITFIGNRTHSEHLRVISKVDIALDTFPFAGQTTTCECLWMGVPVVTLRGDRHCSRVGAALLAQICLNDWIADDCDEYVSITLKKAAQSQELQQLRSSLRDKISSSTLADGDRHAREVLRISRELWRARLAAE